MSQPLLGATMVNSGNAGAAALQTPIPAPPVAQASPAPMPQATFQPPMNPQMYQGPNQRRPSNFVPQTPTSVYQSTPATHQYSAAQPTPYAAPYSTSRPHAAAPVYNPNAPRAVEVFHLSDAANAAIPADIRQQFHCDERGHVLFFSAPPLDIIIPARPELAHSLRYLARKEERQKHVAERKRKREEEEKQRADEEKRQRASEETALEARVEALAPRAIECMVKQVVTGTDELYKMFYHDQADSARTADFKSRESRILADQLARLSTSQILTQSKKDCVRYPIDSTKYRGI